jgi:hypothetical protein
MCVVCAHTPRGTPVGSSKAPPPTPVDEIGGNSTTHPRRKGKGGRAGSSRTHSTRATPGEMRAGQNTTTPKKGKGGSPGSSKTHSTHATPGGMRVGKNTTHPRERKGGRQGSSKTHSTHATPGMGDHTTHPRKEGVGGGGAHPNRVKTGRGQKAQVALCTAGRSKDGITSHGVNVSKGHGPALRARNHRSNANRQSIRPEITFCILQVGLTAHNRHTLSAGGQGSTTESKPVSAV